MHHSSPTLLSFSYFLKHIPDPLGLPRMAPVAPHDEAPRHEAQAERHPRQLQERVRAPGALLQESARQRARHRRRPRVPAPEQLVRRPGRVDPRQQFHFPTDQRASGNGQGMLPDAARPHFHPGGTEVHHGKDEAERQGRRDHC